MLGALISKKIPCPLPFTITYYMYVSSVPQPAFRQSRAHTTTISIYQPFTRRIWVSQFSFLNPPVPEHIISG